MSRQDSSYIELIITAERKKTGYGRDRLTRILKERGISVKPSTGRYVLPLSHFEVDFKEDCISYAQSLTIPPYQWTAIDVKTRLRFISYSYEKSLLIPTFLCMACATMTDVVRAKSEGQGTTKIYPVNVEQAWEIAKTVFRWEGCDAIEEHKNEGYMLTSSGMNLVSWGAVMGA